MEEDHYQVLGLQSSREGSKLSVADIHKAYRARALFYHPDKRPDDPNAAALFQKIQTTYKLLTDEIAYKAFDEFVQLRDERLSGEHQRASDVSSKRRKMMDELNEREKAFDTQKQKEENEKDEEDRAAKKLPLSNASSSQIQYLPMFEPYNMKYSEYTPCEDPERSKKFTNDKQFMRERRCPEKNERLRCLIPDPPGYKTPFPWLESRDFAWYANVPHKKLTVAKAEKNWIRFRGDRFQFPGGGTSFQNGAKEYIHGINKIIPLTDGSIRIALDAGCGVRRCWSWSGELGP